MSFQAGCPQCRCVSWQLGRPIPCLLHVPPPADDPPIAQIEIEVESVSVDRPGPFSLRELARLLVLRGQVRDARAKAQGPLSLRMPGPRPIIHTMPAGAGDPSCSPERRPRDTF
jgi:hypothetical protein